MGIWPRYVLSAAHVPDTCQTKNMHEATRGNDDKHNNFAEPVLVSKKRPPLYLKMPSPDQTEEPGTYDGSWQILHSVALYLRDQLHDWWSALVLS